MKGKIILNYSKYTYLYGIHSIEAALSFNFRRCLDLFVNIGFKDNMPDHIQKLIEFAQIKNVKVKYLKREKLDRFTGNRPHNGVVLKSDFRVYHYIKRFEGFQGKYISKQVGNLIVLLDQIIDPQNLGSIIRTSLFIGADHIMLNKKNKPPISAAVSKVSSGASECVELHAIKNIKSFLKGKI
jgi:21S rRNA (GM2251-2'-O)-methyltransferase